MILVDTSFITDILTNDPVWFDWSSAHILEWGDEGPLCYNQIIFSELAVKFESQKSLEQRLSAFSFLSLPLNAAFHAGRAFKEYRYAGGKKSRPLPDFFIAAHAYVQNIPLLTRDPRRVRTFFPSVHLVTP